MVGVHATSGASRLSDLRQQGSLRALFPRGTGPAVEAVLLNTAGGLTGGDVMSVAAHAAPGTRLRLSTQAAERIYRAIEGTQARAEVRLQAEGDGRIDWLPQETILFDGARLDRRLLADLAPEATCLLVEPLVFGRLAHGEEVRTGRLRDRWEVRRGGRLVFADALTFDPSMGMSRIFWTGTPWPRRPGRWPRFSLWGRRPALTSLRCGGRCRPRAKRA